MQDLLNAAHNLPQCLDPAIFFGVPTVVQILARFNIVPIKKFRLSQLAMYKITDECHGEIAKHSKENLSTDEESARDLVDLYLSAAESRKKADKKTFLTENTLKGVATNVFAAGLDSTATMLIWFVLLLTKYQDVQKKLREEVINVIGTGRLPTLKDRDAMQYVHAVMQETHRFVSVAPMAMFHMVKEDAEYEGYFIPKNTYMISNLWGMHHDERIFPKPFEYQPERFINDAGEFVKSKYVTPYGIGKRVCPGEVLAQRELFLFVTQLVQRFELLPAEGTGTDSISTDGVYDGVGFFPPEFQTRFIPFD
ncbi:putative cytochrome P450 2C21-like isoform X1 [Apostichopus japonicus]|uniref:Putative cytochrome P450 2C21-like isoform X1 n=2 Tax=Stichopus japonicus TaxID=307972 RepID=A0A2G8JJ53_STIJA|nr:putative cytochrome P450 2C21-like isoform X1 [Apostichopus japonicus]